MVFTHGIGGAQDLPIPAQFAIAGGSAALAVSFIVLALAWRTPRFDAATKGRPMPRWLAAIYDSPATSWGLRSIGFVFALYVGWAALFGKDLVINPFFGVVYVWLWVGIVPLSLLFGGAYKALNPIRTLHLLLSRATDRDPHEGLVELPRWVGVWPSALGLLAFVWMELVYPRSTYLVDLRMWFAIYIVVVFFGAVVFGSRWIAAADPFEVLSTLVGRLSPLGRLADGSPVLRSPLANLDGTPASPGLTGVVAVLFGSTAFDSFKETTRWIKIVQGTSVSPEKLNTVGLVAFCVLVFATFSVAVALTGVSDGDSRRHLPNRFAHAVVPIVAGYWIAHYLSYFVYVGTNTLIELSDPLSRGDDYLRTAGLAPATWILLHPTGLAVTKVIAVVIGHIMGAVASHDRAIRLLPRRHQLTGQLSLLVVMVLYTVTGLYLLLSA